MQFLKTADAGFESAFARIVRDRRESDTQVGVERIIGFAAGG